MQGKSANCEVAPRSTPATRRRHSVGPAGYRRHMRPDLPGPILERLHEILRAFPECVDEPAWTGVRWRVRGATVAHAFGGEDGLFRIVFRTEPGEVPAFENMGEPYFRTNWGETTVGILLDDATDWTELAEMLTDSYCVQAPATLADSVNRPGN